MKFTAKINSPDTEFYNEDRSILFTIKRHKSFFNRIGFKNKATIIDGYGNTLLEFEYKYPIFGKPAFKLLNQYLKPTILLEIEKRTFKLTVNNQEITIVSKNKIIGYFEGKFISDQLEVGIIKQSGKWFGASSYNFGFKLDNQINYYCLLLFAIYSIDFYDGD